MMYAPKKSKLRRQPVGRRGGFTLIEMLVAVALVVLIMAMFATVYQASANLVTAQRGLAENNQRSRMLTTLIRNDIQRRSFRDIIPFAPGQTYLGAAGGFDPSRRRGYFSISENDPNNDADDVLSFTILTKGNVNITDDALLLGAARFVRPQPVVPPPNDTDYLLLFPNQPEMDDGQVDSVAGVITGLFNGVGASSAAEVTYFVRNGNLYRRVLLIREPYTDPLTAPATPTEIAVDYDLTVVPPSPAPPPVFWRDFDYSAYYDGGVKFHHWANSLSNSDVPPGGITTSGLPISLGIPHIRFGHSLNFFHALVGPPATNNGPPREYLTGIDGVPGGVGDDDFINGPDDIGEYGFPGSDDIFIGRFTAQETAHSAFLYPGSLPATDPHADTALQLGADGSVTQFSNETFRRGEDILLTNVHAFDVKVWDDALSPNPDFVDLGHNNASGHYRAAANTNTVYGNRYDTWHPSILLPPPPFRPNNGPGLLGDPAIEIPLRAIQIKIRFFDKTSNQMRQVTLVLSLVD